MKKYYSKIYELLLLNVPISITLFILLALKFGFTFILSIIFFPSYLTLYVLLTFSSSYDIYIDSTSISFKNRFIFWNRIHSFPINKLIFVRISSGPRGELIFSLSNENEQFNFGTLGIKKKEIVEIFSILKNSGCRYVYM